MRLGVSADFNAATFGLLPVPKHDSPPEMHSPKYLILKILNCF
jgi:hypothetical protein